MVTQFTTKHYEHLIELLREEPASKEKEHTVHLLSRVLKKDNPRFKVALFEKRILESDE